MNYKLFLILAFFNTTLVYSQKVSMPEWTHIYIQKVLPGSSWGTSGPILGDFDHDGDLDAIVSRRVTGEAYWYERRNDSVWIPHLVGQLGNAAEGLGCTGIDMDGDGWTDTVFEMVWFKNPGNPDKYPDTPWKMFNYKGGGHDIVSCDVNGDGKDEVIVYDGHKLSIYDPSRKMAETIISSGHDDHGGIAPHGFGDIDGDGKIDLVIPGFWLKNGGDGESWTKHVWPFTPVPDASYGRSIRAWVADINKDGRNDIVYGNCDTGYSHVFWVENKDNGTSWVSHQLPDPPTRMGDVEGTGSFHSLGVADFNQDGFPDIFAGEQEDPDQMWGKLKPMKPKGLKERGVIWYNNGNKTPGITVDVIHVDNPGWHDAQIGDVDGDGDIDIVSKVWNADGGFYHADYWRNELIGNSLQTTNFEEVIIDRGKGLKSCWTKTLGDLNGDGKVDLIVGGNVSGGVVWYEAPGWKKHQISEKTGAGTDAETADMDGDGDIDLVAIFNDSLILFENPGWKEYLIDSVVLHDIELNDFDGDGLIDVAGRNQAEWGKGDTLFLFKQYSPDKWEKIKINIVDGEGLYCSDLNNDGRKDLIINGYWLENTGDIHKWNTHRFSNTWNWKNTFINVGDLNNDGRNDIVMSPSEREGHLYRLSWFEAPLDPMGLWKEHIIRDNIETIVHFVDAGDFDMDGNMDIITAEMTQGKDPDEIAVYFNQQQGKSWSKEVIGIGGSHSMRPGDFDQDGDIDLFGANWQEDIVKMWINQFRPQNHLNVNKR